MPSNLENRILTILGGRAGNDRPVTFNDLARQLGATAPIVSSLGRQLVDKGLAQPSYALIRGSRTMYALLPLPVTAAAE